jgi:hypothetical protein
MEAIGAAGERRMSNVGDCHKTVDENTSRELLLYMKQVLPG